MNIQQKIRLSLFLRALALCVASLAPLTLADSDPAPFDPAGYALPTSGDALSFPRDHGSHPDFKTEWWYITGHLQVENSSRKFGFQITFFRSATVSPSETPTAAQPRQIFMAHAAILDKNTGKFMHEERFNREGWNAQASLQGLNLYNGNWRLQMLDTQSETMETSFSIQGDHRATLNLMPLKPKALFGNNGVSRKGEDPTAKSYYITFPRLEVSGSIRIGNTNQKVNGVAWMDHEISSSQLSPGQIGWNWTSLILDDGTELMAYIMRRQDGKIDPYSTLSLIDREGQITAIPHDRFSWTPTDFWKSPATKAEYPISYKIEWEDPKGLQRSIHIKSTHAAQEIVGSIGGFSYWEGAGSAFDANGNPIGVAYTELTGYNESLYGKF